MFVSNCLDINENGHLTIGGCDTVSLAQEFGTPVYVMDENEIRDNCRRFTGSIDKFYAGRGMVAFAGKAFLCKEMCRLVQSENMGLDVVSGGELYTALDAGFPADKIIFHGNNKTPEELAYAVSSKVGRIIVDNMFELQLLEEIASAANVCVNALFRVKPGVEAHTHDYIKTGGVDSKFGFSLETGEALAAIREASDKKHIKTVGVHCHIGSQIFGVDSFEHTAEIMLGLMKQAKDALGYELSELNLGGGFGIKYLPEDDPAPYEKYMEAVSVVVKNTCEKLGLKTPFIIIEPGRSVSGAAGITLYRVGAVKEIPDIRTYVTVDGGMADNPRPTLYSAEYEMIVANKAKLPRDRLYTVSGRCCETDLLRKDIYMPETNVGDVLAVLSTGAYNYSMSSNYNRLPRPPVVFIRDGVPKCVVKRECYGDIIRNDV